MDSHFLTLPLHTLRKYQPSPLNSFTTDAATLITRQMQRESHTWYRTVSGCWDWNFFKRDNKSSISPRCRGSRAAPKMIGWYTSFTCDATFAWFPRCFVKNRYTFFLSDLMRRLCCTRDVGHNINNASTHFHVDLKTNQASIAVLCEFHQHVMILDNNGVPQPRKVTSPST